MAEVHEEDPDALLTLILGLADEGESSLKAFKKKLDDGAFADPQVLARSMYDLFSLVTDLTKLDSQAHHSHFEWAAGVDEDLDEIKAGGGLSALLPDDATRLKALLVSLGQNLRAPSGASDETPDRLRAQIAEAVVFIDSIVIDPEIEEGDDEEDDAPPTN